MSCQVAVCIKDGSIFRVVTENLWCQQALITKRLKEVNLLCSCCKSYSIAIHMSAVERGESSASRPGRFNLGREPKYPLVVDRIMISSRSTARLSRDVKHTVTATGGRRYAHRHKNTRSVAAVSVSTASG